MAKITAETTTTATIRPIAIADNPPSWVVCLFVSSSSVFHKVVVVPDDDIFVGKDEAVAEAVDVPTRFDEVVSRWFVVDTGISDLELVVVLELEYIVCVVENVFSVEVVEAITGGESVVCDDGYEDWDVDICNVEVDVGDRVSIVDDVDRWPNVEEGVCENVDIVETAEVNVADICVVSLPVQSKVQSNTLDEAKHCKQLSLLLNVPLCMQVPFI